MTRTFTVHAALDSHEPGAIVTDKELVGANVDALVASGHLVEHHEKSQTRKASAATIASKPDSGHEGAGE